MKDPAVLFYFQDFLVGTEFMTDDEVGKYIRILCHQADKGSLSELQIKRICRGVIPEAIMEKLTKDDNGSLYQKRMREEREKRTNYTESRRKNRTKKLNIISSTYDKHMENENENINEDIDRDEKKVINVPFEKFWNLYDKKEDRIKCEGKWNRLTNKEREICILNLPAYILSTPDKQYRKNPATYLNNKSWENEIIKDGEKVKTVLTYDEILKLSEKEPGIWKKYKAVKKEGERKAVFEPINEL